MGIPDRWVPKNYLGYVKPILNTGTKTITLWEESNNNQTYKRLIPSACLAIQGF